MEGKKCPISRAAATQSHWTILHGFSIGLPQVLGCEMVGS
jgi:hypothetical protein